MGDPKLGHILEHYRRLAAEANQAALATATPANHRAAYQVMARHWAAMTNELEAILGEPKALSWAPVPESARLH